MQLAPAPEDEDGWVSAVVKASYDGDLGLVARILDANPSLLDKWDYRRRSYTPLMAAAEENCLHIVEHLVERGANLNLTSGSGWSALCYAADRGHHEVTSLLLRAGASATIRGKDGRNALILAASNYFSLSCLRILLEHGRQNINDQDDSGRTALAWACYWANFEGAKLLLAYGADHTIADAKGRTPKMIAKKEDHDACVGLIEWWEAEMIRRPFVLHRARALHDDHEARVQMPSSPVPAYLQKRVATGRDFPEVSLASPASSAAGSANVTPKKGDGHVTRLRKRQQEEEQRPPWLCEDEEELDKERSAVVSFVVRDLPQELYKELLQGLKWRAGISVLVNNKKKPTASPKKRERPAKPKSTEMALEGDVRAEGEAAGAAKAGKAKRQKKAKQQ